MPNRIKHIVTVQFENNCDLVTFKEKAGSDFFSFKKLLHILNSMAPDCYSSKIKMETELSITYKFTTSWYPLFEYYKALQFLYKNVKFDVTYTDEGYWPDSPKFNFTLNIKDKKTESDKIDELHRQSTIYSAYSENCKKFVLHIHTF